MENFEVEFTHKISAYFPKFWKKNVHFKATGANDQNILPHVGHINMLKNSKIKSQTSMIYWMPILNNKFLLTMS